MPALSGLLIAVMNGLLMKLMTEKFVGKLIVHALDKLVPKDSNGVTEKIVKDVANAFDEPSVK